MKILELISGKIKVGEVSDEVITKLGITNIDAGTPIVIWHDRIKYIRKHASDFESVQQFETYVELIPEIISEPDYVGIHPSGNGIEYVAIFRTNVMVAIRFKCNAKELAIRSFYPMKEERLESYINKGRFVPIQYPIRAEEDVY